MSKEMERQFLVTGDGWRNSPTTRVTIGYFATVGSAQVQVQRKGDTALLTLKSAGAGLERSEFEYAIPPDEAEALLHGFCVKPLIVFAQHTVDFQGYSWKIDAYEGTNEGLVVARLQVDSPEETFPHPPWLGEEVTGDVRLRRENLMRMPFSEWSQPV